MLKEMVPTDDMKTLVDVLYKKYPRGLAAYVTMGEVPDQYRGLAKYLAKYVAPPPIAIRWIMRYTSR